MVKKHPKLFKFLVVLFGSLFLISVFVLQVSAYTLAESGEYYQFSPISFNMGLDYFTTVSDQYPDRYNIYDVSTTAFTGANRPGMSGSGDEVIYEQYNGSPFRIVQVSYIDYLTSYPTPVGGSLPYRVNKNFSMPLLLDNGFVSGVHFYSNDIQVIRNAVYSSGFMDIGNVNTSASPIATIAVLGSDVRFYSVILKYSFIFHSTNVNVVSGDSSMDVSFDPTLYRCTAYVSMVMSTPQSVISFPIIPSMNIFLQENPGTWIMRDNLGYSFRLGSRTWEQSGDNGNTWVSMSSAPYASLQYSGMSELYGFETSIYQQVTTSLTLPYQTVTVSYYGTTTRGLQNQWRSLYNQRIGKSPIVVENPAVLFVPILQAVDSFVSTPFLGTDISIGAILGTVVAVSVFVYLIKVFAGG